MALGLLAGGSPASAQAEGSGCQLHEHYGYFNVRVLQGRVAAAGRPYLYLGTYGTNPLKSTSECYTIGYATIGKQVPNSGPIAAVASAQSSRVGMTAWANASHQCGGSSCPGFYGYGSVSGETGPWAWQFIGGNN